MNIPEQWYEGIECSESHLIHDESIAAFEQQFCQPFQPLRSGNRTLQHILDPSPFNGGHTLMESTF
jgi:hypothetical protein